MDCNCVMELGNKSNLKYCPLSLLKLEELMQAYVCEVYEHGFDHPNPYQYVKEIKNRIKEMEKEAYGRGLNESYDLDDRYDEGYNDGQSDAEADFDDGYQAGKEDGYAEGYEVGLEDGKEQ